MFENPIKPKIGMKVYVPPHVFGDGREGDATIKDVEGTDIVVDFGADEIQGVCQIFELPIFVPLSVNALMQYLYATPESPNGTGIGITANEDKGGSS